MRLPVIVLSTLLMIACASTPPERSQYLLRSEKNNDSRMLEYDENVFLGSVSVASYINQPGLVLDQGEGKVVAARYHEWAEPLRVSLRQFLSAEISAELGRDITPFTLDNSDSQRVDITIDQLHGNDQGQAVLVAVWSVTAADKIQTYRFSEVADLSSDGYGALVEAHKRLLQQLSQAIAASL